MPNPVATFKTSVGQFTAEIYLDRVPITASNFIDLCRTGLPTLPQNASFSFAQKPLTFLLAQGFTMVFTFIESFPTL
jgi:hypothetical protein